MYFKPYTDRPVTNPVKGMEFFETRTDGELPEGTLSNSGVIRHGDNYYSVSAEVASFAERNEGLEVMMFHVTGPMGYRDSMPQNDIAECVRIFAGDEGLLINEFPIVINENILKLAAAAVRPIAVPILKIIRLRESYAGAVLATSFLYPGAKHKIIRGGAHPHAEDDGETRCFARERPQSIFNRTTTVPGLRYAAEKQMGVPHARLGAFIKNVERTWRWCLSSNVRNFAPQKAAELQACPETWVAEGNEKYYITVSSNE